LTSQTYRFFKGEPLYPFGFGLSYATFQYDNLNIPADVKAGESIKVSVNVKNTGKFDGDEVVQLYATKPGSNKVVRELKAFKRVHLKQGEQTLVEFVLAADTFKDGQGKIDIAVGGGQPDQRSGHRVLKSTITIN
jgi:beta-glucosidase